MMISLHDSFARITIASLAIAAFALTGCDKRGDAGGPGATDPNAKPLYGQNNETFNLTAPAIALKQGDSEKAMIGIKRGTNFSQDVAVVFGDLPKGVTIELAGSAIKSAETDVKFTITAGEETVPGDYTVKVTGHPVKGGDATNEFKLSIAKKDTFTLTAPFFSTGLKQGETKNVAIGISRDRRFDQDVTLKFEGLPKGVTFEPIAGVIKNGESEAKFGLKATDEAALGDFAIKVTGHPTRGADSTHEFKFTIAKK